ncbi:hypothetical protein NIES4071_90870 [Calothrix sp. NIES-4071]|nr:hypothetical protein NIES4071_90870 [Calothrix sp. NIES-4071]BAZ63354.1 hypothetical protein NIES4105_90800 [Calothrix sp. NIES-4105]
MALVTNPTDDLQEGGHVHVVNASAPEVKR